MTRYWIAIASADHVRRGRSGGFMQVCHGKAGPLRRIQPGDGVVYYSPTDAFRGPGRRQAFTAIGRVREGEPYQHDMGGGFVPYRRDVAFDQRAREASILPLLEQLSFSAGKRNWGFAFRFGLFEIAASDFAVIRQAMDATVLTLADQNP